MNDQRKGDSRKPDDDRNDAGQGTGNSKGGVSPSTSQKEGPAAYARHQESEDIRSTDGDPSKKKTGEF